MPHELDVRKLTTVYNAAHVLPVNSIIMKIACSGESTTSFSNLPVSQKCQVRRCLQLIFGKCTVL